MKVKALIILSCLVFSFLLLPGSNSSWQGMLTVDGIINTQGAIEEKKEADKNSLEEIKAMVQAVAGEGLDKDSALIVEDSTKIESELSLEADNITIESQELVDPQKPTGPSESDDSQLDTTEPKGDEQENIMSKEIIPEITEAETAEAAAQGVSLESDIDISPPAEDVFTEGEAIDTLAKEIKEDLNANPKEENDD